MQVLGLYEDPPFIHLAVLEKKKNSIEIRSLRSFLIDPSMNVKQLYIPEWKGKISTSISSLVRHLDFPPHLSEREIAKGIPFQIESISPLSASDIKYFISKKARQGTVFITSKELLQKHLDRWKQFEIVPDLTTSIAQAQFRFLNHKYPHISSAILIHLGGKEWNCSVVEENRLIRSHTISVGINDLLQAFWEDRKKVLFESEIEGAAKLVDLLQIKSQLNPSLFKAVENAKTRLNQTLTSFIQENGTKPVLFSGRVDAFCHLKEYLCELPILEPSLSIQESLCALAAGMALETYSLEPVQFLTDEFYSKKLLSTIGAWGFSATIFSLIASLATSFCGSQILFNSKQEMLEAIQQIFPNQPFDQLDENNLQKATKIIQQTLHLPYYLSNDYSVSSFLYELASHPLFHSIELKNIDYEMISYPKIDDEKNIYQAKIQFEFETENHLAARKIHEALLSGDWLADNSEEISWETSENLFRTSFILRQLK